MKVAGILILISILFRVNAQSDDQLKVSYDRFKREVDKKVLLDKVTLIELGCQVIRDANYLNRQDYLAKTYLGLASGYIDKNAVDSSLYYGQKAYSASVCLNDTSLLIQSHLAYGWTLIFNNSDYDGAISEFRSAEKLSRSCFDAKALMASLTKLIMVYYLKEDMLIAYKLSVELIKLCDEHQDTVELVNSQYMLGSIYGRLGLHNRQVETANKLLALEGSVSDTASLYKIYYAAHRGYLNKREYPKALFYARKNVAMAKAAKKYPTCYGYLADIYFAWNQLDSAKYYYEKMLNLQFSFSAYIETYEFLNLAKIELQQGNRKKAYHYLAFAERDVSKPTISTQKEIYKALYEYYLFSGQKDKAFHYLQRCEQVSDSLVRLNNSVITSITVLDGEAERYHAQIVVLEKDKKLKEVVLAKFKQTQVVIYASFLLFGCVSIYALARYKKQKNRKAREALNQERLRISRELHDEVGSTLSGIAMYSHLVNQQLTNHDISTAQQSLTIIQQSAKSMMTKLSDIIWLINPEQESLEILFDRVREYGRQMTQAKNIKLEFDVPPHLSKLTMSMEARRHIFLFCKESINNAVKYSGGSILKVVAVLEGNQVKISVSDNGIGFDELKVRKGNGLKNMEHRATSIGGQFHIDSAPDQGATIHLQYNLTQ